MSNKVKFDYSKASSFISEHEVEFMKKLALDAKEVLVSKTGAGNDFYRLVHNIIEAVP